MVTACSGWLNLITPTRYIYPPTPTHTHTQNWHLLISFLHISHCVNCIVFVTPQHLLPLSVCFTVSRPALSISFCALYSGGMYKARTAGTELATACIHQGESTSSLKCCCSIDIDWYLSMSWWEEILWHIQSIMLWSKTHTHIYVCLHLWVSAMHFSSF